MQWLVQNLIDLGLLRSQKRLIRTELFLVVFELATQALDDLLEQAHLIVLLLLHEVALRDTYGVHIILSWARRPRLISCHELLAGHVSKGIRVTAASSIARGKEGASIR